MRIIINNPYRVAGILSNSTEKDILKQKSKVKRFSEVGKTITSEYDFPFLDSLERSSAIIDKAFSDIEQNQNKVTHSLFWFINMNSIDNTAIQHLISGNKEKAIEIWEKLTVEKEVNPKNFSAFNNIGTLYLLENSREKIKQGVTAKMKLIDSENFKYFIHTVADETFSIDTNKQIEIWIDELLTQLTNKFSIAETIHFFSNCSKTTQKYLSQKFTEAPIHRIETQIEQTQNKRSKNKIDAYRFGIDLHQNTSKELTLLKSILGKSNLQYKMLADNVAKEIVQCSIDYFNESQEQGASTNYHEEAMKLVKFAQTIAINEATKNKIKESIETLEEMKQHELNLAIELLKSVKKAYEDAGRQIDKQVEEMQYTTFGNPPMRIPKPNVSINWTKVREMKRNALDWDKIVALVKEAIPPQNVTKIKLSDQQTKITEYKSLVDFILEKLNYSQKNQVKYLCYWKTITTTAPTSSRPTNTYTPTSSSSSDNDGCAPWIYWVVGIIIFIILIRSCN